MEAIEDTVTNEALFFNSMLFVRFDVSGVDIVSYFHTAGGVFVQVLFHVHICENILAPVLSVEMTPDINSNSWSAL